MQLITFIESDRSRAGILKEDGVIDLSIACPGLPSEMLALIQAGPRAIALAASVSEHSPHFPLTAVRGNCHDNAVAESFFQLLK